MGGNKRSVHFITNLDTVCQEVTFWIMAYNIICQHIFELTYICLYVPYAPGL